MGIRNLYITNYKSIRDITLTAPNQFTVFVGPNASGKSNIFEAVEFMAGLENNSMEEMLRKYKGEETISNRAWLETNPSFDMPSDQSISSNYARIRKQILSVRIDFGMKIGPGFGYYKRRLDNSKPHLPAVEGWEISLLGMSSHYKENPQAYIQSVHEAIASEQYQQFINRHSRIFVDKPNIEKTKYEDNKKLSSAAGNLEEVLARILENEDTRIEFIEWLQLLVPGFENVEITKRDLSGKIELLIYEKGVKKPFSKSLISDGTFNIIAILTAVYQSDKPQFLWIEEPENGLNPKVVKELVGFFRQQCAEKGHYIWLNTHSQTLVRELTPKEIILVDKKDGETTIKQIQDMKLHGLKMDEALLSGVIGGGIPW